jgi:predicted negative regulator of RcsB-dependent stress response
VACKQAPADWQICSRKIDEGALRGAVAAGLAGDKDALNKLKGSVSVQGKTKQAVDALKSAKIDKAALQSAVVAGMSGRPDKALKQLANAVDDKTKAAIKAQIGVRLNAVQS